MNPLNQTTNIHEYQYQTSGKKPQSLYPHEALIRFLACKYLKIPRLDRQAICILEVGCGSGANLWMLAKEGFDAYGIDNSTAILESARRHLNEKWGVEADLRNGSFSHLPYDDEYFDAVVDVACLQQSNIKDSRLVLSEIERVLKPWGLFFSYRLSDNSVMYEHAGRFIDAVTSENIRGDYNQFKNNGPLAFWSPSLTRKMYTEAGLGIEAIERVGRRDTSGTYVEYLAITGMKL